MVTYKDAKKTAFSIAKALDPFSVVLFGSVAREGVGKDLDLLVVMDDARHPAGDPHLLLHKCLQRYYRRFSIDPFVIPLSRLNDYYFKGSPFLHLIATEGRILYMKDLIQEWCRQSQSELEMATYLLQGGFFKGACYHAQQSIERAVKAKLFKKGWGLERTYSIERLIAIGKDYKIRFPVSDEEITFIDKIYQGRYPIEAGLLPLGEPSKGEAEKVVEMADRLLQYAKKTGK